MESWYTAYIMYNWLKPWQSSETCFQALLADVTSYTDVAILLLFKKPCTHYHFRQLNLSSMQGLSMGWTGWLITQHQFYSFTVFSQNYVQIQPQEDKFLKFFWRHAPRPNMLSVVHTLCRLTQHSINPPPTLNSAVIII